MLRFIDTHCHFDEAVFDHDRFDLLRQLPTWSVSDLILPATTYANWTRLLSLRQQTSQCHISFGLHPVYLPQHRPEHLASLAYWLRAHSPVAVGECGLDFYLPELDPQAQEILFIAHIRLACEFDLPLIIHARRSVDVVLKCLRRFPSARGIIHSFAGSQQQAEQLIHQGFYLGVGGTLTYPRAQRLREVMRQVPLDALVLETDAPDQPDSEWRGKRNTPERLSIIATCLAELRQTSLQIIADVTTQNAIKLFKLAP